MGFAQRRSAVRAKCGLEPSEWSGAGRVGMSELAAPDRPWSSPTDFTSPFQHNVTLSTQPRTKHHTFSIPSSRRRGRKRRPKCTEIGSSFRNGCRLVPKTRYSNLLTTTLLQTISMVEKAPRRSYRLHAFRFDDCHRSHCGAASSANFSTHTESVVSHLRATRPPSLV